MEKQMPSIVVDMDDVICEGGYLYLLNKFLGSSYTIEDFEDCYYIDSIVEDENKREELIKYWFNENVYKYTYDIPYAYDVLKRLSKNFDIYICTDPFIGILDIEIATKIYIQKYEYLIKHFEFISPKNYIFCSNKSIVSNVMFQVDDRVLNLIGSAKYKILFNAYHNKNISDFELSKNGIIRKKDWKEIEDYISLKIN